MNRFVFGFDVGGTSVKGGMFREGSLEYSWEFATNLENGAALVMKDIAASMTNVLRMKGYGPSQVKAIGVGLACPVDGVGKCGNSPKLPWEHYDAKAALEKALKADLLTFDGMIDEQNLPSLPPIVLGNDATYAAIGEQWKGGAQGVKNVVCITLGTGIGVGIIENDKAVFGAHGQAGELAKLPARLFFTAYPFPSGPHTAKLGLELCSLIEELPDEMWILSNTLLDDVLSAKGLVNMVEYILEWFDKEHVSLLRKKNPLNAKSIVEAWEEGDQIAGFAIEAFTDALGKTIAMLCATLDPEIIIIAGGLSLANDTFLDQIRISFISNHGITRSGLRIEFSKLDRLSGVYGAAYSAYQLC